MPESGVVSAMPGKAINDDKCIATPFVMCSLKGHLPEDGMRTMLSTIVARSS